MGLRHRTALASAGREHGLVRTAAYRYAHVSRNGRERRLTPEPHLSMVCLNHLNALSTWWPVMTRIAVPPWPTAVRQDIVSRHGPAITAEALDEMSYGTAVARELLRITPAVPAVFRLALVDFELQGRRIPKVGVRLCTLCACGCWAGAAGVVHSSFQYQEGDCKYQPKLNQTGQTGGVRWPVAGGAADSMRRATRECVRLRMCTPSFCTFGCLLRSCTCICVWAFRTAGLARLVPRWRLGHALQQGPVPARALAWQQRQ